MSHPPVLIVPGRGNSESAHWQSILEHATPGARRVQQLWDVNDIETWSENIDHAISQLDSPPLVVAHSFGCLATAYAQFKYDSPIAACIFVAPADPARFGLDLEAFAKPLPRPGFMIASANDPWLSLDRAQGLARAWGIESINLGMAGHINVASGHGHWPYIHTLVETMRNDLDAIQRAYPQTTLNNAAIASRTPWARQFR